MHIDISDFPRQDLIDSFQIVIDRNIRELQKELESDINKLEIDFKRKSKNFFVSRRYKDLKKNQLNALKEIKDSIKNNNLKNLRKIEEEYYWYHPFDGYKLINNLTFFGLLNSIDNVDFLRNEDLEIIKIWTTDSNHFVCFNYVDKNDPNKEIQTYNIHIDTKLTARDSSFVSYNIADDEKPILYIKDI